MNRVPKAGIMTMLGLSAGLVLAAMSTPAAARSSAECDAYARDYADHYTRAGENVVGGAVAGAIGGALLGGIISDKPGKGALIGAGVGTAAGAVNSSARWRDNYDYAFHRCMSSSRTAAARGPEPGSPEWYDYCEDRYRSFNPETGMFLSTSGAWKPCR
jgi:BA14K-like protein/YMGG-like Gly-zipper